MADERTEQDMRKTVDVERIKALHNQMNADSVDAVKEGRKAITLFADTLLIEADQYRGFRYTNDADPSRQHLY